MSPGETLPAGFKCTLCATLSLTYPYFFVLVASVSREYCRAGCAKLRSASGPQPSTSVRRAAAGLVNKQLNDFHLPWLLADFQKRQGNRQPKAARPGAAGIQIQDPFIQALLGHVGMAADDGVKASGL